MIYDNEFVLPVIPDASAPDVMVAEDAEATATPARPWISCGLYVGVTGQPQFDPAKAWTYFQTENAASIHWLSPWNAVDGWGPWKFSNGKFLLKQWNEDWWTHTINVLETAASASIGIEMCLLDKYGAAVWQKYPGIAKYHPFRNNDNKDLMALKGDEFYVNWIDRRDPPNAKNCWVFWYTDENDISTFHPCNGTAQAVFDYITRMAAECFKVFQKYPNRFRLMLRSANEPISYVQDDGKTIDYSKKTYLDDRWDVLIKTKFIQAGFNIGPHFNYIYTTDVRFHNQTPAPFWMEKSMRAWIRPKRNLAEVHGIERTSQIAWYQTACGYTLPNFIPSSDGVKEDTAYYGKMKAIAAKKYPYFDYKLKGVYTGPDKWRTLDMNFNVKTFVPMQEAGIFS